VFIIPKAPVLCLIKEIRDQASILYLGIQEEKHLLWLSCKDKRGLGVEADPSGIQWDKKSRSVQTFQKHDKNSLYSSTYMGKLLS
jgi:hypothetical protein